MKEEYKNKIQNSIRNHNLFPTAVHALRNRWPIWTIKSKEVRALQLEDRSYRILKKKYQYIIDEANNDYELSGINEKIIWVSWLQGIDAAPILVKRCFESLKKNLPNYDIRVIDASNIFEYVEMPDYIVHKWKKGIIPYAHFSDILRTLLLVKYGGVWVDSTVLCTDNEFADKMLTSSFFAYKMVMGGSKRIVASSWLIAAEKNHPILVLVQNLLYEYWKKENILINYFLFHIFFTLSTEHYVDLWENVPTFNNVSPHIMVSELDCKFNEERYLELKQMSSFHKLNYKLSYKNEKNTFYKVLIENGKF